jgi:hypothetical protein
VSAAVVADEIEKIPGLGIERSANRSLARTGNRARRQPGVAVRVVGRIEFQVALRDGTDGTMIQVRRINHRGVALQWPAFLQTPGKHTGDYRAFARRGGFLLHQRGESDDVVQLA